MSHVQAPDWDPLAPEAIADPIGTHARLRHTEPVPFTDRWGGFWSLTKYSDIVAATRDTTTFGSRKAAIPLSTDPKDPPRAPLEIDPPHHDAYRRLLNPFFAPRRIRAIEPAVRLIASELVDSVLDIGPVDLVPTVTFPMPVRVLCVFLGIPDEDGMQLKRWTIELTAAARSGDKETHKAANGAMYEYIRHLIAERRANRRDPEIDLVSRLVQGFVDEERLSDETIAGILRVLLAAGHQTTTNGIGNLVHFFATDQAAQARLRANPSELPLAIEEVLRVWSPSRALGRLVLRDTVVRGKTFREGDHVAMVWTSGNRDEDVFERADEVIIGRRPNQHLAFGHGIHTCLGAPLARTELRVLGEEILRRTSSIRMAGEPEPANWPHIGSDSLPVELVS